LSVAEEKEKRKKRKKGEKEEGKKKKQGRRPTCLMLPAIAEPAFGKERSGETIPAQEV
jgi:hypothetical protein